MCFGMGYGAQANADIERNWCHARTSKLGMLEHNAIGLVRKRPTEKSKSGADF